MTTAAALTVDHELAIQRVRHLEASLHSFALSIRECDRLADLHDFHGRVTLTNATLERRQNLVHQRSLMLREVFLERQILRAWRR
jgi:hypothetical protein